MLRGALAAAVTPLRDEGAALDEEAFRPYLEFLAAAGLDGILALGTTGEGILLSAAERRRAAELFLDGPLPVIVHCGAQTSARPARSPSTRPPCGAAGVAVISPPYFPLDDAALLAHLAAAARAAEPVPFYVYEFKARSGYAVPVPVLERLRERAPNFAGLKVSDKPFEAVEPYLLEGLDVFVGRRGARPRRARARCGGRGLRPCGGLPGARGRARPRRERRRRTRSGASSTASRSRPRAKYVLGRRGVPVREDVRAPLRTLNAGEKRELDAWLESS